MSSSLLNGQFLELEVNRITKPLLDTLRWGPDVLDDQVRPEPVLSQIVKINLIPNIFSF